MALTKKQREFFDRFSRNILVNTVVLRLEQQGTILDQDTLDNVNKAVESIDITSLVESAGEKLLERVDFATLVKVEKFLTNPETQKALTAAQEVGIAVQVEVYEILSQLFAEPASSTE